MITIHSVTLSPPTRPWGRPAERAWTLNVVHHCVGQRIRIDDAGEAGAKALAGIVLGYEPVWVPKGWSFIAANPAEHCFAEQ